MNIMFAHSEPDFKSHVRYQRDDIWSRVAHPANVEHQAIFGRNLKAAREAKGWSQQKLADEADVGSKGYISDLERGGRPIPPGTTLGKLASALGVAIETLVGRQALRPARVPLVGYVGAGAEAHFYATADEGLGEVEAPDNATPHTVAVEVRGTSLGPLFESWLVFYDEVRSPVTPDLYGRLCVVGLPDDRVLVKRVKPAKADGYFHLESNTEPTMSDQLVAWAARVKSMTPR